MKEQPNIPQNWNEVSIGEIATVVAGGTPKASNPDNFTSPGEGIAWLTPADLSKYKDKTIQNGARDLTEQGYTSSSAKLMPKGTLLFSSRAPIGYVAIAAEEISTNQGFKNFIFPTTIDPSYAYFYLRSIRHIAEAMGTGTTFKEISGASAKKLPFVLAPIAEQKVIADKLDTLLAQVESTKARLERIPQILKRFRQSVLAAAVSGKLSENWRKSTSYTEINEHYSAPTSWQYAKLESFLDFVTSGSRGWAKYYSPQGALFIRSQDINTDELKIHDAAYVSLPEKAEGTRTKVRKDDLLLTITGANVTKCARIKDSLEDAYISQHVALIRPDNKHYSAFLEIALKAENAGRQQLKEMAYGGGKPGLNLANIKDVELAIPSEEEQQKIVRRVSQIFAYADTIEKQVNNALARVEHLTHSILAKAFRGELTEQWRKDNPDLISGDNSAATLLERIQSERAAAAPIKRGRKKAG